MDYCLDELLTPLLTTGYRVLLRPHPEYVKRFPDKMESIRQRYEDHLGPHFEIQTDYSKTASVYTADLVITDWSSIAQEFSYATKKPSLFINTPMKIMNAEYEKIPLIPLDISLRDQIGRSVGVEQLGSLPQLIEQLLSEQGAWQAQIEQIVSDNIFDVGQAAKGGGDYIIERLTRKETMSNHEQDPLRTLDVRWERLREHLSDAQALDLLSQLERFEQTMEEEGEKHA